MIEPGHVVLLNGPSSAGKSSIARAMLPLLDEPWFFVPVDAINSLRSTVHRRELNQDEVSEVLRRTRLGYHRVVAALASSGNNVIMDYPLSEPWRLRDLLEVLQGFDVTVVDVACSPGVLVERERRRGDRPIGLAASQSVFDHDDRDIAVDTTSSSAEACAGIIVDKLSMLQEPKAFDRIRKRDQ